MLKTISSSTQFPESGKISIRQLTTSTHIYNPPTIHNYVVSEVDKVSEVR